FTEYSEIISRKLGDRVKEWITINDPFGNSFGNCQDELSAANAQNLQQALAASHHLLLAHGLATSVIRANSKNASVGISLNLLPQHPASSSLKDRKAAVWADGYLNRWFLDPLTAKGYPQDIVNKFETKMEFVKEGDLDIITEPIDFLGINYVPYNFLHSQKIKVMESIPSEEIFDEKHSAQLSNIDSRGLLEILGRLYFNYAFPSFYIIGNEYISQNQASKNNTDSNRLANLYDQLSFIHCAIQIDIPVLGYFTGSLSNNTWQEMENAERIGSVKNENDTRKFKATSNFEDPTRLSLKTQVI
nr:family 1 glycosylhydrolase [Anaerolineaceae bacterium]